MDRLSDIQFATRKLLPPSIDLPEVEPNHPDQAAGIVAELTWICIDRIRRSETRSNATDTLSRHVAELQALGLEIHEHALSLRTRRLAACQAGLARLRTLPTSKDLLDQACEEIAHRCGFGRVMLSRVEDNLWKPWLGYFSDPDEIEAWFGKWSTQAIQLGETTLEAQLLTERRPAIVQDASALNAPVFRPIVQDAGATSYVVAPVMPGGTVVGLLHADHHPSTRRVDEVDRDVLWAFAEGFGHIYERLVLLERMRVQRDGVRDVLSATDTLIDDLCDAGIDLLRQGDAESAVTRSAVTALSGDPAALSELTAREREVLELMVVGATNGRIAEQLVITEGTVKSHVKHILRKLGVMNRSQAIARYLGTAPNRVLR